MRSGRRDRGKQRRGFGWWTISERPRPRPDRSVWCGVAVRRRGGGVVLCRLFSYTVVRELTDDFGERRVAVALVVGNREKLLRGKETEKKKKKTKEKRKGIAYKIFFNIMLNVHAIAPADGSRSRCYESGLHSLLLLIIS